MASGYCWSAKIRSVDDWKRYVWKKVRALYVPFIICNGGFVLLGNFFLHIGLYTGNDKFLALTADWPIMQSIFSQQGIKEVIRNILKVFLFIGPTQMGTATWFLTSLFIVLLIHSGIEIIINKLGSQYNNMVYGALIIFAAVSSQLITWWNPPIHYSVKCIPCTYLAFLIGLRVGKIDRENFYSWRMCIISFIVLLFLESHLSIELSAAKIGNVLAYTIASTCGWILLKSLAHCICKTQLLLKIMSFIGRHTLAILCLHVLSFKLVSGMYIYINKLSKIYMAAFHIIFDANEIWKLLYLIVGVFLPLMVVWVFISAKNALHRFN